MSELPRITIDDYDVPISGVPALPMMQFMFDEDITSCSQDNSPVDPLWPFNAIDGTASANVDNGLLRNILPPSSPTGTTSPTSPPISSSPTSYGNDPAESSPINSAWDHQLDRPNGWLDWMHNCKAMSQAMSYREHHEDSNSAFADDAFSGGLASPSSGHYESSSHSPASSPGLQTVSLHFENMAFNEGLAPPTEYLSPTQDEPNNSISVPSSPNLLRLEIPPLHRSCSARTLGVQRGHQHSPSDPSIGTSPFLDASPRGRGRNRANTAPSSRRGSPYPRPHTDAEGGGYARSFQMEHRLPFYQGQGEQARALSINTQLYLPNHIHNAMPPYPPNEDVVSPSQDGGGESGASDSGSPLSKPVVTTAKTRQASEHKRKHDQKFECCLCGERFTTKNKRDRHVDAHRGIKRFPCEKPGCVKAFTSSADRKRHQENPKHQ